MLRGGCAGARAARWAFTDPRNMAMYKGLDSLSFELAGLLLAGFSGGAQHQRSPRGTPGVTGGHECPGKRSLGGSATGDIPVLGPGGLGTKPLLFHPHSDPARKNRRIVFQTEPMWSLNVPCHLGYKSFCM